MFEDNEELKLEKILRERASLELRNKIELEDRKRLLRNMEKVLYG